MASAASGKPSRDRRSNVPKSRETNGSMGMASMSSTVGMQGTQDTKITQSKLASVKSRVSFDTSALVASSSAASREGAFATASPAGTFTSKPNDEAESSGGWDDSSEDIAAGDAKEEELVNGTQESRGSGSWSIDPEEKTMDESDRDTNSWLDDSEGSGNFWTETGKLTTASEGSGNSWTETGKRTAASKSVRITNILCREKGDVMEQALAAEVNLLAAPPIVEQMPYFKWDLNVHIKHANDLKPNNAIVADPFCELSVAHRPDLRSRTRTQTATKDPVWNVRKKLPLLDEDDLIIFEIFNEDSHAKGKKGESLGRASLNVVDCIRSGWTDPLFLEGSNATLHVLIIVDTKTEMIRRAVTENWGIIVTVFGAENFQGIDFSTKNDLYCEVTLMSAKRRDKTTFRTATVRDDPDPVWDHEELVTSASLDDKFLFVVFAGDEAEGESVGGALGECEIEVADHFPGGLEETAIDLDKSQNKNAKIVVALEVMNEKAVEKFQTDERDRIAAIAAAEAERQRVVGLEAAEEEKRENAYMPAPLQVRTLCRVELRRVKRELLLELENVKKLDRNATNASGAENALVERQKAHFRHFILSRRRDRLRNVDSRTFAELPQLVAEAATDGDVQFIRLCRDAGVNFDIQDQQGVTPLIAACVENNVSVVRLLLESKADPCVQDVNGATTAHYAVQLDHIHVVSAILDAEAYDVFTVKDVAGRSAVDYARRPERASHFQCIRQRMGGPGQLLMRIFKGWVVDKVGIPRQLGAYNNMVSRICDTKCMTKASPVLRIQGSAGNK